MSLDWNDEEMGAYYDRVKAGNRLRLHELATEWPGAAAQCVHETFTMTLQIIFNTSPPANPKKPQKLHADGIPARCEPGLISYVASYLGIVEPQMRYTEHIHMLMQVMGFTHPREFFKDGAFKERFREVWSYCASLYFTSQEGWADHCTVPEGMAALREAPLMPVKPKQREKLGEARSEACLTAQALARGLPSTATASNAAAPRFGAWTSAYLGDTSLPAAVWACLACIEANAGSIKCGNHVCLPKTCHKGRWAKLLFLSHVFLALGAVYEQVRQEVCHEACPWASTTTPLGW